MISVLLVVHQKLPMYVLAGTI